MSMQMIDLEAVLCWLPLVEIYWSRVGTFSPMGFQGQRHHGVLGSGYAEALYFGPKPPALCHSSIAPSISSIPRCTVHAVNFDSFLPAAMSIR
jgi:hypothetical protein